MQIKVPLEYIWRPVADAIDRWIDRREQTNGGLCWPLMFWIALIGIVIAWAVTAR
jgi:hypothetical protein